MSVGVGAALACLVKLVKAERACLCPLVRLRESLMSNSFLFK